MDKARVAEFILSLFVSREHASATVGDFAEKVEMRGPLWFWRSVCQTTLSLCWRDFAAEPIYMAGLGLRGMLMCFFFILRFILLAIAGLFPILISWGVFAGFANISPGNVPPWIFNAFGSVSMVAVNFQTGQWIAGRARGREIAACINYELVSLLVIQIVGIVGEAFISLPQNSAYPTTVSMIDKLLPVFGLLSLFTGAIRVRRQTERPI